jgi:uncharacterized Zn-binding protein involved in type VI secretion
MRLAASLLALLLAAAVSCIGQSTSYLGQADTRAMGPTTQISGYLQGTMNGYRLVADSGNPHLLIGDYQSCKIMWATGSRCRDIATIIEMQAPAATKGHRMECGSFRWTTLLLTRASATRGEVLLGRGTGLHLPAPDSCQLPALSHAVHHIGYGELCVEP